MDSPKPLQQPEQRKFGQYVIHGEIGRGGMGVVYKAHDPRLGRFVALKVLTSSGASAEDTARFTREAHAIAKLRHQNIVTVHDVGEHMGMRYYAMELLRGDSLDRVMRHFKRLPPQVAMRILAVTADAIEFAHSKGVLHRDIKPANIFLELPEGRAASVSEWTSEEEPSREQPAPSMRSGQALSLPKGQRPETQEKGCSGQPVADAEPHRKNAKDSMFAHISDLEAARVVLTDFGLARDLSAEGQKLTATGSLLGTPHYMSPEQAARDRDAVGVQSDVYSLGATLYEALTGKPPFSAPSLMELVSRITSRETPKSPVSLVPHLSEDVETIVMKALEKDRRNRYRTAGELRDDLTRCMGGEDIAAKPPTTLTRLSMSVRRNKSTVGVVAAVFVVLLALVLLRLFSTSSTDEADGGEPGARENVNLAELQKRKQEEQAAESFFRAGLVKEGAEQAAAVARKLEPLESALRAVPEYWLARAHAHELLGERQKAVDFLGHAIELAKKNTAARELSARSCFERGRIGFQLAVEHLICHKATAVFGSAFTSPQAALDAALADFAEAVRFDLPKAQALYADAARKFAQERFKPQAAREVVAELLELEPQNEAALLLLAELDYFAAEYDKALRSVETLLARHRGLAGAYLVGGLSAMWEEDYACAANYLEKVIELSSREPVLPSYALLFGWWMGKDERFAVGRFGNFCDSFPQSATPVVLHSLTCLLQPRLRAGWQNLFQNLLPAGESPENRVVNIQQGRVITNSGLYVDEITVPKNKEQEERIHKLDELTPSLKRHFERDATLSAIPAVLGMACAMKSDYFHALEHFSKAAEAQPPSPFAVLARYCISAFVKFARDVSAGRGNPQFDVVLAGVAEFDSCPANRVFTRNLDSRLLRCEPSISIKFSDETLEGALKSLAEMTGLRIEIAPKAEEIARSWRVTVDFASKEVEKIIAIVLSQSGLDCVAKGTRVLVAKEREFGENRPVSTLYENTDLQSLIREVMFYTEMRTAVIPKNQVLNTKIKIDKAKMPIRQFLEMLRAVADIKIAPEAERSGHLDTEIVFCCDDLELELVLDGVLIPNGLDCIHDGETILVTTQDVAGDRSVLRKREDDYRKVKVGQICEDVMCQLNLTFLAQMIFDTSSLALPAGTPFSIMLGKRMAALFGMPATEKASLAVQTDRLRCWACYGLPELDVNAVRSGDLSTASYEWTDDLIDTSTPADKPLMWDKYPAHGAMRHVLFVNRKTVSVPEDDFQYLMNKYEKGRGKGVAPMGPWVEDPITVLGRLHAEQMKLKTQDLDKNGLKDFWTKDVAGMYFKNQSGLALAAARADRYAIKTYPELGLPWPLPSGYWLRAIVRDRDGNSLVVDTDGDGVATSNVGSYGICAYPASYGSILLFTYIVNETGVVWKKDLGEKLKDGIDQWPAEDPASAGWIKAD